MRRSRLRRVDCGAAWTDLHVLRSGVHFQVVLNQSDDAFQVVAGASVKTRRSSEVIYYKTFRTKVLMRRRRNFVEEKSPQR